MRYIKFAAFVFMAVLATTALSQAQSMKGMKGMKGMDMPDMASHGKTTTIQGEVVDLSCYMSSGAHGAKHKDCALKCIRNGEPVGILTKSGKVILALGSGHETANHILLPYVAEDVKVTGQLNERGGIEEVSVKKVEPISGK